MFASIDTKLLATIMLSKFICLKIKCLLANVYDKPKWLLTDKFNQLQNANEIVKLNKK